MGGKSVAAFSLHSEFVPFPVPQVSAPSRMTPSHAGTRTRALRTQQVSTFLPSPLTCNLLSYCSLGVKTFAFPLSARRVKDLHRNLHPQNAVAQQFAPIGWRGEGEKRKTPDTRMRARALGFGCERPTNESPPTALLSPPAARFSSG